MKTKQNKTETETNEITNFSNYDCKINGKFNVKALVTKIFLEKLSTGIIPWIQEWNYSFTGEKCTGAYGYETGKPYSMLNSFSVLCGDGAYLTMKQIKDNNFKLKKGSKASTVFFWSINRKVVKDKNNKEKLVLIPLLRYYNVFHESQIENFVNKWDKINVKKKQPKVLSLNDNQKELKQLLINYIERENINYHNVKGNKAFYRSITDEIVLPLESQFKSTTSFLFTLSHEVTHSTGNTERLNRLDKDFTDKKEYSKEELVAEITACMLSHKYNIATEFEDKNSLAYVQSWLKPLKDNPEWIVSAISQVEKAMLYIEKSEIKVYDEPSIEEVKKASKKENKTTTKKSTKTKVV